MAEETRGEKLNNPGNIRISNNPWQGKITPSSDSAFEQFSSPEFGIRAMAKILITYFNEGICTITAAINKWAPAADNNPVAAYIGNVCDRSGFDADAQLNFKSIDDLWPVVHGMIDQEQGGVIYADQQIIDGCQMALSD